VHDKHCVASLVQVGIRCVGGWCVSPPPHSGEILPQWRHRFVTQIIVHRLTTTRWIVRPSHARGGS